MTPENFWKKVHILGENDCWPWKLSTNSYGYGATTYNGRTTNAHRIAYFLTHGDVSPDKVICHTCDNRICCNPAHLWEGTQGENVRDCARKGRSKKTFTSEDHPRHTAKLDTNKVKEMRQKYAEGAAGYKELSEMYGVHSSVVCRIINNKAWRIG